MICLLDGLLECLVMLLEFTESVRCDGLHGRNVHLAKPQIRYQIANVIQCFLLLVHRFVSSILCIHSVPLYRLIQPAFEAVEFVVLFASHGLSLSTMTARIGVHPSILPHLAFLTAQDTAVRRNGLQSVPRLTVRRPVFLSRGRFVPRPRRPLRYLLRDRQRSVLRVVLASHGDERLRLLFLPGYGHFASPPIRATSG